VIFEYRGRLYPELVKHGGGSVYVAPIAMQFCKGRGLDVGAGKWPLPGAIPVDIKDGGDAMELPHGPFDFIFSSHCLEHLTNPVAALEHWRTRLREPVPSSMTPDGRPWTNGGVLFLYLPHPDMTYWRPENCRKHLHSFTPERIEQMLSELGYCHIIVSGCDLAFGFSAVAFRDAL
jgi:SAM-dependent methyltransferase